MGDICLGGRYLNHTTRKNVFGRVVQVNLIIMLSLGSMETDCVISEPFYNEVIYNRHIEKYLIWEP